MTSPIQNNEATVGDLVVIGAHHLGEPEQFGEILEILPGAGRARYRVRWDDDPVSVFYPGSDATIRPAHKVGAR